MTAGAELEEIESFRSPGEFERFVAWLELQLERGALEELPVGTPYGNGNMWRERWFRLPGSDEPWRLVEPDVPFYGIFMPVDPDDPAHAKEPTRRSARQRP